MIFFRERRKVRRKVAGKRNPNDSWPFFFPFSCISFPSRSLFNALVAFSELPMTMNGRPILFKQKSFALFRPSAFGLAGVLSEIPFSAPRLFLFCVITFFMTGLDRNIGGFFTFYINVYFCYLAMVWVERHVVLSSSSRLTRPILSSFFLSSPPIEPSSSSSEVSRLTRTLLRD